MVVDDAAMMCFVIQNMLSSEPYLEVADFASNGK